MEDTSSQPATAPRRPLDRLALAVAGLRDGEWLADLGRIGADVPTGAPAPPTFAALAAAGIDTVDALAADGRWEHAADQADRLRRVFTAHRATLHPVVGESFDGLRAAAHSRDADELADFVGLLREIFDGSGEPGV